MAEFWTEKRIAAAIDAARQRPDIQAALISMPDERQRRLRDRVQQLQRMILEATLADTQAHGQQEQALLAHEQEIEALQAPRAPAYRALEGVLAGLLGFGILAAFIGVIWGLIAAGPAKVFAWLVSAPVLIAAAVTAVILTPLTWASLRERRRTDADTQDLRESRRSTLQLTPLRDRLKTLADDIQAQGAEAAERAWRRALSEFVEASYAFKFAATDAPGLNTAFSPHLVVETPARARLLALIAQLRGASIGIAGPRGAGKTTLVQSLCGPHVAKIGTRDVLSVATSAPVEYQSRDFLLHLFSSLCHRVVERLDTAKTPQDSPQRLVPAIAAPLDVYRTLLVTALVCLPLGLVLAGLSIAHGEHVVGLAQAERAASAARGAASAPSAAAMAAASAQASVAASAASAAKAASAASAAAVASAASAPVADASGSGFDVLAAMGVTPASSLVGALTLLVGGGVMFIVVVLKVGRLRRESQLARAAPAAPGAAPAGDSPFPWVWLLVWLRQLFAAVQAPEHSAQEDQPLVKQARFWLQEIKFQQSWTVGWSGALKMPFGVEGGLSQARSMAQQQLSLPEIADAFASFVGRVAEAYTVIIGIDELDKIESDEKAQRFLNDIKVVFGVKGVFFLVSVSQDAMSQFERRGLPFRDAFDSAFDEVVAVQHLDFDSARLMLSERVIGLPVPFQALCWVMSGGLARELVRSARNLVEQLQQGPRPGGEVSLDAIALALVRGQLAGKARAIAHAAERLVATPASIELLRLVDTLGATVPTPQSLVDAQRELRQLAAPPRARRRSGPDTDEGGKAVRALAAELSAYVLYLAGVLHFFDPATLTRPRLDDALQIGSPAAGWLSLLPGALRLMAVHPELARARVLAYFQQSGAAFNPPP